MPRTLDATQAFRASRSGISPVTLVKLTTYTDAVARTGGASLYFSNIAVTYDYGNTGVDKPFAPVVVGGSPFVSSLGEHIPNPYDLTPFRQSFDLHLQNELVNAERLSVTLDGLNMYGADIEIAQILVNNIDTVPVDGGFAGSEHTVLFRGRVRRVSPVNEFTLTIQCETVVPTLASEWIYARDATKVSPRDMGKRCPRAYGDAKHIPIIAWEVGFEGTLSETIDATEDNVNKFVDSTAGLPASPTTYLLLVDREKILCTTVDATTINIETGGRGQDVSLAAAHDLGASFLEMLTSPTWVISDQQSDDVPNVYRVNESTGRLIRIEETQNEIVYNLADTTTVSGRTVTSMGVAAQTKMVLTPNALTGETNTDRDGRGYNGDYDDSAATYAQITLGNFCGLQFPSHSNLTRADRGVATVTLWLTLRDATDENIEVRVDTTGGTIVETISSGSLPAAGSAPQAFSFEYDSTLHASDGSTFFLYVQMVGGSGDFRIFHAQIEINQLEKGQIDQEGTSTAVSDAGVTNPDNVIDGSNSTFASFDTTNNQYLDVTFDQPAGVATFDMQTVSILMKPTATRAFVLRKTDATNMIDQHTEPTTLSTPEWRHFMFTDGFTNVNTIRFQTTTANDFGDIYRVIRTIHDPKAIPEIITAQLYADIDGVEAPGSGYQVSTGVTLEHPADIMKHWVEVVGGETVNAASYSALVTALGAAAKWAFDVRSLGFKWDEILQRMAFEARCNVVPLEESSGREWHLLSADSSYGFGAATSTLSETHTMRNEGRSLDDIANDFTFRYAFDASLPGGGSEEGYKLFARANPDNSDVPLTSTILNTASLRTGRIESGPVAFLCIQDPTTAEDVAGYIAQEKKSDRRKVFHLSKVAWFDGLPLAIGDIVDIAPPWSNVTDGCRIISMTKDFNEHTWEIIAVQISENGQHT